MLNSDKTRLDEHGYIDELWPINDFISFLDALSTPKIPKTMGFEDWNLTQNANIRHQNLKFRLNFDVVHRVQADF